MAEGHAVDAAVDPRLADAGEKPDRRAVAAVGSVEVMPPLEGDRVFCARPPEDAPSGGVIPCLDALVAPGHAT